MNWRILVAIGWFILSISIFIFTGMPFWLEMCLISFALTFMELVNIDLKKG